MAYVYRHIRHDTNKPFYIGIGSDKKYERAYWPYGRNPIWNNIAAKTTYDVEILLDGVEWEQAIQKEIEFIALYGRINNETGILSNLTNGGEGVFGRVCSHESKERMRKAQTGKKLTEEHKANISKGLLKPGVMDNARLANSLNPKRTGAIISAESREKMRVSHLGKKLTEEHKRKIGLSSLGRKHNVGRVCSPETKIKISESVKRTKSKNKK